MSDLFIRWAQSLCSKRTALLAATFVLFVVLLVLQNSGVFPLQTEDFIFFVLLTFLIVLYRPAWGFLFFVSLVPLEIVNVAPETLGVALRPYQLVGALTFVALIFRYLSKSLGFRFVRLTWIDIPVAFMIIGGFLSASVAAQGGAAFKQSVVVFSFGVLYALSRQFLRNAADTKAIVPFVLGSGAIVSMYALWQNVRFAFGQESFEVMAGRANATFAEPDWLGMYLVALVSLVYALLFSLGSHGKATSKEAGNNHKEMAVSERFRQFLLYGLLFFFFVALILTVARSAWLGVAVASILFIVAAISRGFPTIAEWCWKEGLLQGIAVAAIGLIALGTVLVFHLTTFQLFNRAQSVTSGWQKITVSCNEKVVLPEHVPTAADIEAYGCRHINLEERESEQSQGRFIQEVYRDDPNVNIRKRIYGTVFGLIRENPFFGIGWGNVSAYLGKDERGAGLNASNVFLEVWLGSGLIGFIAFCALWFGALYSVLCVWFRSEKSSREALVALFVVLSGAGLTVFNLFNSGLLLGFVWIWLATAAIGAKPLRKNI